MQEFFLDVSWKVPVHPVACNRSRHPMARSDAIKRRLLFLELLKSNRPELCRAARASEPVSSPGIAYAPQVYCSVDSYSRREAAMHTYQELAQDIPKEYEALKESAHRFAAEVLRPASIELDRMADPRDVIALDSPLRRVFKKGYELGYHVASLPVESGGHGLRGLGSHILIEELSWGAVDLALSL